MSSALTGLIVNTMSQRNRAGLRYDPPAAVETRILDSMNALPRILAEFESMAVRRLVVDGGDGTLQAVLTALYSEQRSWRPRLSVLAGGMTNMVAGAAGLQDEPVTALTRLSQGETMEVLRQPVLRVAFGDDVRCGVFLAMGGVLSAIRMCRREVHARGLTAGVAVGATLGAVLAKRALMKPEDNDEIFHAYDIAVAGPESARDAAPKLMLVASTAERLSLGIRPFWADEPGPIHMSWIRHPAPGLLRHAPALLRGHTPQGKGAEHLASVAGEAFTLETGEDFTLDGEIYDAPADRRLKLDVAGEAEFLR